MPAAARSVSGRRVAFGCALEDGRLHQRLDCCQAGLRAAHCGTQTVADSEHLGEGSNAMSEATRIDRESLPPALVELVDGICDRFESAWKAGKRLGIEEYLVDVIE